MSNIETIADLEQGNSDLGLHEDVIESRSNVKKIMFTLVLGEIPIVNILVQQKLPGDLVDDLKKVRGEQL